MPRTALLFLCCLSVSAQVPSALHATSATNRQVQLAWTAGAGATGYIVERKPLGGQFAAIAKDPVTEPAWTDSTIDAFTTYVFRVRIAPAGKQASNEITVGPPPVGFSAAAPTPKGMEGALDHFALYPQLVLDSNGDPAVSYFFEKGEGEADSTVHFVSWDRAKYHWNAPVEVGKIGAASVSNPVRPFSLARDASTNVYGLAIQHNKSHSISIAFSIDNGATWQLKPVVAFNDEGATVNNPNIALANGTAHLVWTQNYSPHLYSSGKESDPPAEWKQTPVPTIGDGGYMSSSLSMALDSEGKPGIAYFLSPNEAYNVTLVFWRPGGSPSKVTDSHGFQNDGPAVHLDFFNTKPRIAFEMGRTEARFEKNEWDFVAAASDDGKIWPEPVLLPNDGGASMGRPIIAIGSKDQAVVAMDRTGGSGGEACDIPKLSRSSDYRTWKTCSPTGPAAKRLTNGGSARIKFAANGKLYAVISNAVQGESDGPAPVGVVLWREP